MNIDINPAIPEELLSLVGLQPLETAQTSYDAALQELRGDFLHYSMQQMPRVSLLSKAADLLYHAACIDATSSGSDPHSVYGMALYGLAMPYNISQQEAEAAALAKYRLRASGEPTIDEENAAIEASVPKRRGRPPQDKATRAYTIDRPIAEYIDGLPEGERSRFVNSALRTAIEDR